MAIVESTTIEGPSRPCVCVNSSPIASCTVEGGGKTPLIETLLASEGRTLACSPAGSATFPPRRMTVSYIGPSMPYLRMQGRWLERAGFGVGTSVHVEVSERRLIVEAVEREELRCAEPNCPHEAKSKRRRRGC
jgi:hypothetical protein